MPDAHVPVGIEYALLGKHPVGRDEIFDERGIDGAAGRRRRLRDGGALFDCGGEYQRDGRTCDEAAKTEHAMTPQSEPGQLSGHSPLHD